MRITIHSEQSKHISRRTRERIERFLQSAFRRESSEIARIDLTIAPFILDGEEAFRSKLQIHSKGLGLIVVTDADPLLRTATQQAAARARNAFRRRRAKRLARFRRRKQSTAFMNFPNAEPLKGQAIAVTQGVSDAVAFVDQFSRER